MEAASSAAGAVAAHTTTPGMKLEQQTYSATMVGVEVLVYCVHLGHITHALPLAILQAWCSLSPIKLLSWCTLSHHPLVSPLCLTLPCLITLLFCHILCDITLLFCHILCDITRLFSHTLWHHHIVLPYSLSHHHIVLPYSLSHHPVPPPCTLYLITMLSCTLCHTTLWCPHIGPPFPVASPHSLPCSLPTFLTLWSPSHSFPCSLPTL